jgi:hypothetical protein
MLCDELYKEKSKAQLTKTDGTESASVPVDSEESKEAERLAKMMIDRIDKALES